MADDVIPVVLELAPLPREQIGPFLILGVDKDADAAQIEAHWARRLIWARTKQISVPLEDINWSREVLNDRDKRIVADVTSLNPDIASGELRQLMLRHGPVEPEAIGWIPSEPPPPGSIGPDDLTLPAENETAVTAPAIPVVIPALDRLWSEVAHAPLDPWADLQPDGTP
jgi:hypothetical protein